MEGARRNQVSLNDSMSVQGWTLLTCNPLVGLPSRVIYFPRAVKLTVGGQFPFLPRIIWGGSPIDLLKIIDEIHDRIERPGTVVARFGDVMNIHLPLCLTLQKTLRT